MTKKLINDLTEEVNIRKEKVSFLISTRKKCKNFKEYESIFTKIFKQLNMKLDSLKSALCKEEKIMKNLVGSNSENVVGESNSKISVTATFKRYGKTIGGRTIILTNVYVNGEKFRDHVWVKMSKQKGWVMS